MASRIFTLFILVFAAGFVHAQGRLSYALGDAETLSSSLGASLGAAASASTVQARPDVLRSPTDDPAHPQYPPVESDNYGQWLFAGHFARQSFTGFNPGYVIGPGDLIDLRFWGGR